MDPINNLRRVHDVSPICVRASDDPTILHIYSLMWSLLVGIEEGLIERNCAVHTLKLTCKATMAHEICIYI